MKHIDVLEYAIFQLKGLLVYGSQLLNNQNKDEARLFFDVLIINEHPSDKSK